MTTEPDVATGVTIGPARPEDLPAIMGLESAGFGAAERWTERSWLDELLGDGRTVLVARAHEMIGVITIRTTGELADLHRLIVAPAYRRSGTGAALVTAGLAAARDVGARAVILEVAFDNDPAIALYQNLGFEQLGARENYYGPGRHALILKLYDLQEREP